MGLGLKITVGVAHNAVIDAEMRGGMNTLSVAYHQQLGRCVIYSITAFDRIGDLAETQKIQVEKGPLFEGPARTFQSAEHHTTDHAPCAVLENEDRALVRDPIDLIELFQRIQWYPLHAMPVWQRSNHYLGYVPVAKKSSIIPEPYR